MPIRRALVSQSHAQRRGFVIQIPREHNRLRQIVDESAGGDDRRVTGQIGDQQAGAARGGRDENIPLRHQGVHLSHEQRTGPLRADIFDRRDETCGAETVGPIAGVLAG